MAMRIDQEYMEEYVIKPIQKKLKELESTMWVMKNNIAKLMREVIKEETNKKKVK